MTHCKSILVALIALTITPIATAQIYKCNGPDGPIFTDQKCGPEATIVDVSVSSGLGGISDETKNELAAKKAARDQIRKDNNKNTASNNQYSTINTQPEEELGDGQWEDGILVRTPIQLPNRDGSLVPRPVQLPAINTGDRRRN